MVEVKWKHNENIKAIQNVIRSMRQNVISLLLRAIEFAGICRFKTFNFDANFCTENLIVAVWKSQYTC